MPFFKLDSAELYESINIDGPGFSLNELSKTEYTYPIDGWYWFDDEAIARIFFELPEIIPE